MRFKRYALWGSADKTGVITLSVLPQQMHPDGLTGLTGYGAQLSPPVPLAVAEAVSQWVWSEVVRSREKSGLSGKSRLRDIRSLSRRWFWSKRKAPDPARSLLYLRRRVKSWMDESGLWDHCVDQIDAWHPDGLTGRGRMSISGARRRWASLKGPYELSRQNVEYDLGGDALISTRAELQDRVYEVLTGRSLMTEELGRALTRQGVTVFGDLDELLATFVLDGSIERTPAVQGWFEAGRWRWQCMRCTSVKMRLVPCHRCGWAACARCLSCDSLGVSTACKALYHRVSECLDPPRAVRVELPFALTPSQQRLSQDLVQSDRDALIWAACGSGKTEAVLEVMRSTLALGGRVLFALPRRDVVTELGARMQDAIIGAEIVTLSGDTPDKYATAPLVVSTVHQAVRFRHAFDLVVVDEVDAFPLNQEPWLLAALSRAKRPGGRVIMMTATPPDALKRRVDLGRIEVHTLPGRPHGHPLPVPEIVIDPAVSQDNVYRAHQVPVSQQKRGGARTRSDERAMELKPHPDWAAALGVIVARSVKKDRRILVFVPSVRLCETVARGLQAYALSVSGDGNNHINHRWRIGQVHAGDLKRSEKISAFSRGELDVLVSTSILERGITLAYLDVVVFMADAERLFDAATLIQMAGRAGRRVEDPFGKVIFLAANRTPAMDEAISTIQRFNALAESSMEKNEEGAR